ncbi:(Fe-S)-binding protein [Acetobacterium tundrae]|uniref:(Fe-S)-binding protein n=1 Tax=Acetobacterium tundrae TaxID=132932 RepID=A0ABR6WIP8_9FIRM|nr:(Fe-S)-binding protein [Acetobacterium tundrae]MBC3796071.1 (Fe-S)-binding protein [Acetobacterium tundrae]
MKEIIKAEIFRYVRENENNYSNKFQAPYFDEPLVQFASATDELFSQYKEFIAPEHLTPQEVFDIAYEAEAISPKTVISIVLPVSEIIRQSNRIQKEWASDEWTLLRTFGDDFFIDGLNDHLSRFLNNKGYKTVNPINLKVFKKYINEKGPLSNWSQRHVAFAAGLGTFSINDGFITEKGIAVRLTSLVTEVLIEPDKRKTESHTANCLYLSKGTCKACFKRCPVGAITEKGHDKIVCAQRCYGEESQSRAKAIGGNPKAGSGCGLCQTNIPCEFSNPMGMIKSKDGCNEEAN